MPPLSPRPARVVSRLGLLFAAVTLLPTTALAWQIKDPLHNNCHERQAHAALTKVGYVTPPTPFSGEDVLLPKSVQFDGSAYDKNIYAWSLVLGVRFPDTLGGPDFDFDNLAHVHNALGGQGDHCLRATNQDGAAGDVAALNDCRAMITSLYWLALASLDATGGVDADLRVSAPMFVPAVGKTDYPLSGYYFYAGRGLHAVQDSFTHTYRSPDWRQVLHVFNWSEQVMCTLEEGRDGHGHETLLDNCEETHADNAPRMAASIEASRDFLQALKDSGDRATRQARLDAFLAKWFTHQAGCDPTNNYCDNDVHAMLKTSTKSNDTICAGCTVCTTKSTATGGLLICGLLALAAIGLRRRSFGPTAMWFVGAAVAGSTLLAPTDAQAQPAMPAMPAAAAAADPAPGTGYHTEVRASLSVQNPAYAIRGAGVYAWKRVEVGGFLEFNPWYSAERATMSAGVTNLGVFVHYLHPIGTTARLRTGVGLGLSRLNSDIIGSKAGTTGYFLELRLLGIVLPLSDSIALTIDGFDLALPAPQMVGWPILYAQHRFSIGLQF